MSYEVVIGLEVHVELLTNTKLFCSCANKFGASPNTQVCPVCLGLPGVLPVVNRKAVELLLKSALAMDCRIPEYSKFDRKNYFYPDMPKNYQISQYDNPLSVDGYLEIDSDSGKKRVRIKRIHLEEDTGKSTHLGTIDQSLYTLEDYNRAGVPLMEIVTEPDISSPQEAYDFLTTLKALLQWIRVSDCKMEEGSLRCDANVSLKKKGDEELGVKTEVKNMNSFKAVRSALAFEIERQEKAIENGERIIQETRGWEDGRGITISLRSKEYAHDYRYFPEPDLVPMKIEKSWLKELEESLPELPLARKSRLMKDYGIDEYDAGLLVSSKAAADFFEETFRQSKNLTGKQIPALQAAREISNWIKGDISKYLNAKGLEINDTALKPGQLAKMIQLISEGTISGKIGKSLVELMLEKGGDPDIIIKEKGWVQISGTNELLPYLKSVFEENPTVVKDFLDGKEKALAFLVGKVMKATAGRANPEVLNKLLKDELEKLKV
ncbi:MAG: Asp-tRNA(Asn)/Glu-tRNA(Gln) amidotransferase subunit GatB [Firmicutes bacterium]|nr:Asp-tRNA(Asn)/Glu-tRNA(Gln) amidotransferase subunit GatB [Bacillota bacterium]